MSEGTLALLIGLVTVILGSLIVLIPIAGLTARFALKSFIDRALALFEARQSSEVVQMTHAVRQLEQRVALLEQELHANARQLQELSERAESLPRLPRPAEQE